MAVRFVLAVVAAACGLCVASSACSSFTGADDTQSAEDAAPAAEGSSPSADGGAGTDARPVVDCDATTCRAPTDRYVFMTVGSLPGNFAADGGTGSAVAVANQFCADQANRSTHPDLAGRSWQAWLCLEGMNADGRVVQGDARWIRPDGEVVFANASALRSGLVEKPIDPSDTHVWTGCVVDPVGAASNATCMSWTSSSNTDNGVFGVANQTTSFWSSVGSEECSQSHPLYCFESE